MGVFSLQIGGFDQLNCFLIFSSRDTSDFYSVDCVESRIKTSVDSLILFEIADKSSFCGVD